VQIGCVVLRDFRNYRSLSYRPSARLNVLSGRNAQGKTNVLEALAVLLTGRSFRTSRLAELPTWGEPVAALGGDLVHTEGTRAVRRTIQRLEDGRWESAGDICPWARVIAFGWQDLTILNGPPAARRSFIDGFAARLYAGHLAALLRYRQILARRNRLLQVPGGVNRLAPWDEQLATTGMELIDRRRRAVAALATELARIYPALAGVDRKVQVAYRTTLGEATELSTLLAALEQRRGEELRRGVTLTGPHRDDLAIELNGTDVRAFASRGEQRLLVLALRLAEVLPVTEAAGTPPVLLLDDALSELDAVVGANLLREIQSAEQVFLTTPAPVAVNGAACWRVEAGEVLAA
jgi:DNA replication and repair protein RecF